MSLSDSPAPSLTPTVRFLERFTKQVSIISPVPDSPARVVDFAPIYGENSNKFISPKGKLNK